MLKKVIGSVMALVLVLQSLFTGVVFADTQNVLTNDFESNAGFSAGSLVTGIGGRNGKQLKMFLDKNGNAQLTSIDYTGDFTAEWNVYLEDKKGNWIIDFVDNSKGIFANAVVLTTGGNVQSCYPSSNVSSYEVGKWYNFAVEVKANTGKYNLYINGEKTDTSSKIFANSNTDNKFNTLNRIKISNTGEKSSLYIDDLKIYKGEYSKPAQSLTSSVYEIKNNKIYISGADITAGDLTKNLTSAGAIAIYSDPACMNKIDAGSKVGKISYLTEYINGVLNYYTVLGGDLKVYYDFDNVQMNNANNAVAGVIDMSGNGFDGLIENGQPTLSNAGVNGKAVKFSGNTADKQIVKVKNSENNFNVNANDKFTMVCWAKRTATVSEWKGIAVKGRAVGTTTRNKYYGIWNAANVQSTSPYSFSGSYGDGGGINIYDKSSSSEEWTHLAAVWNNKKITFYVNGKSVGNTNAYDIDTSGQPLYIGGVHPDFGRQFFGGEIDDFGIFDYVLDENALGELAKKKTPKKLESESLNAAIVKSLKTAVDKANELPFGMYTQESVNAFKATIEKCNSVINSAATAESNALITKVRECFIELQKGENALSELPSLQMHLSFDEITNGTVSDLTQNGFEAVAVGTAPTVVTDTTRGKVASFDGNILKVKKSENNFVYNATDSYTMSVWVKPTKAISEWKGIAVKGRESGAASNTKNYYGMWIAHNTGLANAPTPYAYSGKQGTRAVNIYDSKSVTQNEWKNLVIVQDGTAGTVKFYIDGKACSTVLSTADVDNSGMALYIGGVNEGMLNQRFSGLMDDFCVYNYAVGADGISALAKGETPEKVHQLRLTYDAAKLLNADIEKADKIDEKDYLEKGMAEFKTALANAKLAAQRLESAESIENARLTLNQCMAALVKRATVTGWIFEKSGKSFADIGTSKFAAQCTDTVNVVNGKKKKAAELSGTKLTANGSSGFAISDEFTVAALVKPSNTASGAIVKKGTDWDLYFENNSVKFSRGGTEKLSAQISTGEWHYVMVTEKDSKLYLYVNNEKKAETTSDKTDYSCSNAIEIADGYKGLLEDLRVYNYYPTDTERESMYKRAAYFVSQDEWLPNCENPKLIFDTDFGGDVDDVGALAVIHNYVQNGSAELLAVVVNRSNCGDTAAGIDAINTYYGSPDIPIGVNEEEKNVNGSSNCGYYLAQNWENDMHHNYYAENAVDLYRKTLAAAEDNSVTIVITGHMTNLANLLRSGADEHSNLTGKELVAKKVKFISMMGGGFTPPTYQPEHNIVRDLESSTYVIENSPVKILFSGYEIGQSYWTGGNRNLLGNDHPLKIAYDMYLNDESGTKTRASYDQTSVVAAVEGLKDYWDIKIGVCSVDDKGYVSFDEDGYSNHAYLLVKKDKTQMQEYIDKLMMDTVHDNPDEKVMTNIDETDSNVKYTGTFTSTKSNMSYKGSYNKAVNSGSGVEYTFVGNEIEIFGTKSTDAGKIEVFIDNVSCGVFDMYQPVKTDGVPLFKSGDIGNGKHTIKAVLLSEKNSASSATAFYFDCFKVYNDYKIDMQSGDSGVDISIKQISKDAKLFVAMYDDEGRFIGVKTTNEMKYGKYEIHCTTDEMAGKKVKAFYWNGLTPLVNSAELE